MKLGSRWYVRDPIGRKGGMFVAWSDQIQVKMVRSSDFYIEIQVATVNG